MQALSPVSTPTTSQQHQHQQHHQLTDSTPTSTTHAPLTINPAALLGAGASSSPNPAAVNSIEVKQEPDEEASFRGATRSASVSHALDDIKVADASKQSGTSADVVDVKGKAREETTSLADDLLRRDHNAILRPDLSAFADARDAMRRLLPYHVWNIPQQDLLRSLGLKHDPVLSEVRSRKRQRIARLERLKQSIPRHVVKTQASSTQQSTPAAEASAEAGPSTIKADTVDDLQVDVKTVKQDAQDAELQLDDSDDDAELSQLGLPVPLPEIPLPEFPTLAYAESVFARRHSLAARFRRTLTALDTTHKRAPNTSISLEHLQRLAYNDDREQVLAQIKELKALKDKLEELEQAKGIDPRESSAKINLSFGITNEIEREREKERELERIKRQQERAAAKAAKLEKEREARHRLGIFTPPLEPPAALEKNTPTAPSPAPTATSAGAPTSISLPLPTPYSSASTPASTPGGYPFPPGASLSYPQPGPNGFPMPPPFSAPGSAYSSMPATPYGPAQPFAAMPGAPDVMPNGMQAMATPTSAPFMTAAASSMPGTPSTPAATPSKPPSKSKAKAKATASTPTPIAPGTPGTPGVTPGPTPHRGRGRPRKHPLPGTPGGPPLGSSVPRKRKEKQPAAPGTPGTPSTSAAGPGAMQVRPPSASPVPPTMPGPAPGYSGEMFVSTLPPTPTPARPPGTPAGGAGAVGTVRPTTMHPTLTSATSLNTPRATPPVASPSTSASTAPAKSAIPKAAPNGTASRPSASASTPAPANANPSIPNHPIPLLIPVSSLPRLSALGIQPTPSPHIRPIIGPNGQPQGLQGLPIPIDPNQSVPAVLLGISEGTAEAGTEAKQQILHISVVLSRLSPSQLSGLAVLMQSLQAEVEANKAK